MKRFLYALLMVLTVFSAFDGVAAKKKTRKPEKVDEVTIDKVSSNAEPVTAGINRERKQSTEGASGNSGKNSGVGKPVERELKKASGRVFDVRALPSVQPRHRDRPEREGPEPNPVMIEREISSPELKSLEPRLPVTQVVAPAPIMDFDGLDRQNWGAGSPPDTTGDVGPVYYIQSVNTSVGIYRKSDGFQEAAFTYDTLMAQGNFGNQCDTENFGDPVVLYDTFEDRWILTDFAFTLDGGGNVNPPVAYQCFAVSMTGNPISGGWNFYSIAVTDGLNDYPKLGVWTDGIYMSANMFGYPFGAAYQGARVWALNKAQMYAGNPTVQVVSFDLGTGDFTVVPSNARLQTGTPPPGRPNYFLSTWNFLNGLTVYKFHVDWNSISLSTFTGPDVPIAATSWPNAAVANAPQTGTATLLDVLQIRAMVQNQYTNFAGAESLWIPHTVRRANTTGFAAPRWYQVSVTGGPVNLTIPQATTWDPDAANVMHRFMPSLALDRMGNLALGYSTSNSTTVPAIKYAGRLATDPVNTFSYTEQTLFAGLASQTGTTRWGDYSSMMLDPNGCTFWFTSEYGNTDQAFDKRWRTRINSFTYPECTPVGAGGTLSGTVTATVGGTPISGATVQLGARTTTTNGSGFYSFTALPAGTYPLISATKPGYSTASASSIVVTDGGTTVQDFALAAAPTSACLTDTTQADFLTGVLTNVDVNTAPGDVTLVNIAIDQQNTAGTTTGTGFGTPAWTAQTFIPAVSGQLLRVESTIFCNGCGATPPNLTLSVRATAAGLPTGADLASVTIPGSNYASGASVTFMATFGAPATLTAGTQYALVMRPVSAPAGSGYFWIRSSPSTYANGQRVLSANSGATWTADATRDYNFKAVMAGPYNPTSGNVVSSSKDSNPAAGLTAIWSTLSWNGTTPANTTLQYQVAGSNNPGGPFTFVGPDGTAGTFFSTSGASLSQFYGLRYLRYKAGLSSTNNLVTPAVQDVSVCFSNVDCSGTVATITPTPAQVCPSSVGNTATGSAGATSYSWSITNGTIQGSTTSNSISYTAGAAGTVDLTLAIVMPSGCQASTTVNVPIGVPPTPTVTPGGPTTFCSGGSVTLTSSSASGNQWYDGVTLLGGETNQTYVATTSGSYNVVVTAGGCSSAASTDTVVTVTPTPATPTITPGGPTTFCTGGSVTLTSSSASGNQWYLNGNPIGGETNQAYVATTSGDYSVVVTASGCSSAPSANTTVTVNPIPATPTITPGGPTTFCTGGSVTLTSSSASGNQWYLNGNPIGGETNQAYVATASGDYSVVVTASGCSSAPSANTTVTVNPIPATPTITPGGPTTFCAGGSVTLTSSSASGNQWYLNGNPIGGETNQAYVASGAGDYTVVVTTSGCSSAPSATTTVTINPLPNATITAPASVVAASTGNAASVADAGVGATYNWTIGNGTITGGAGTANITFTAGAVGALTLDVTVTTAATCTDSDTANVTVTAVPVGVTVTNVAPNNGTYFGGTAVTITGTGFLSGAAVTFGGSAATSIVVVNATTITAVTPAHVAGAVNVTVTNADTTTGTLTNGYTYSQQFDANGDGTIDPSDIFYLVNYLFSGGPAPAGPAGLLSGDANGDGVVDPADIFYLINYLFLGGPQPAITTGRISTEAAGARLAGEVTLGAPVVREGRTFIPVMVSTDVDSIEAQAMSLKVRVTGDATVVAIRRAGAAKSVQPAFEITRATADGAAYLVAFDARTSLATAGRSVIVAEVELARGEGQIRIDIDPSLTMLSRGGVQKATVAAGTLRVRGVTVDRSTDRRLDTRERN